MEAVDVPNLKKVAVFDVLWQQCRKELERVSEAIFLDKNPAPEDMDLISSACVGLFRGVGLLSEHQRRGVRDVENISIDHTFSISDQQAGSILRILLNRYSRDLKKINRDIEECQQLDHTKCVQIVAFLVGMLLVTDWGKNA